MDHSLGESQNYHRPIEEEILDDYLNAVNNLTINDENRLKLKVQQLEGKSNEIQDLKNQVNENSAMLEKFIKYIELVYAVSNSPIGSEENQKQEDEINQIAKNLKAKGIKAAEYMI